jgi:hypothetical protein
MARHGGAWRGKAWPGMAWQGMAEGRATGPRKLRSSEPSGLANPEVFRSALLPIGSPQRALLLAD